MRFPLDGKIKLAVAGVSEIGRKKWFPLARKSVSTSRNQVTFQKLDLPVSTNERKSLSKRLILTKHQRRFPLAEKSSK